MNAPKSRSRRAREGAGLSVGQAAKLVGITRDALIRIEELDSAFWAAAREKLADVYGVNLVWLSGLSDLHDYEALKRVPGAEDLPFHDRDILAEVLASRPRKSAAAHGVGCRYWNTGCEGDCDCPGSVQGART